MYDEDPDDQVKTMWSESLFDSLYLALRRKKEDNIIKGIIQDLKLKDYSDRYIINRVKQEIGSIAATRIEILLTGKPPAPVNKGNKPKRNKKPKKGLLEKIRQFFFGKK